MSIAGGYAHGEMPRSVYGTQLKRPTWCPADGKYVARPLLSDHPILCCPAVTASSFLLAGWRATTSPRFGGLQPFLHTRRAHCARAREGSWQVKVISSLEAALSVCCVHRSMLARKPSQAAPANAPGSARSSLRRSVPFGRAQLMRCPRPSQLLKGDAAHSTMLFDIYAPDVLISLPPAAILHMFLRTGALVRDCRTERPGATTHRLCPYA